MSPSIDDINTSYKMYLILADLDEDDPQFDKFEFLVQVIDPEKDISKYEKHFNFT